MARLPNSRRVALQVGLGVAVSMLVTITVVAVSATAYLNTRAAILTETNERIDALLRELSGQVATHLGSAVPPIEFSRTLLRDSLVRDDSDALARQFILMLRANPSFSWMSYSDAAGNFTGAYRGLDGKLNVSQSTFGANQSELHEYVVDDRGQWTATLRQSDYGYDPRADRFYDAAKKAASRVWVGPYVFFDEGVPGITCAAPYFDASGLRGVFTIDFNLNALSRFVAALPFGQHGRVFILDADGVLIAHPSLRLVQVTGQGSRGEIVTVANAGDPLIPAWFDAWQKNGARKPAANFSFAIGNERFVAGSRMLEFDRGVSWVIGAAAPESDFLGLLAKNRLAAVIILASALVFGVLVSLALARRIASPLTALAGEMAQVGEFVLTDRAPLPTRFREVALIDRSLLAMKGSLRSFSYYVPTELVRAMLSTGQEARLEGHTSELTVCFADIAGFTSIAESMAPAELVQHLSRYFDDLTRIIAASGGTIDKFIGDAIMAFWGAPAPAADHAARACEAAVRCQRALAALRASAETPWLATLHARIGVASGQVLVGNVGTPDRFNYTVMGDTVNLASRLESLNKVYGTAILVSEPTYAAARHRIIARLVDFVQVKGKHVAVAIYEPLALATDDDPDARQIAAWCDAAFVAYRNRNFQNAAELFARVRSIRPDDGAAALLEARCHGYIEAPPPDSWVGVHIVSEK